MSLRFPLDGTEQFSTFIRRNPAYPVGMTETSPDPLDRGDTEPDARTWVLDDGTSTDIGPVERALREDLRTMRAASQLSRTLIASATALAQAMDRALPDKIASIGREFREHLRKIEDLAGDDDDASAHTSNLSSPV